jgi:hypothetical protein
MAATHQWSESNGAGEVVHDGITNLNFGNIDSYNIVPSSNPIARAANSFAKYIRCKFTDTYTEISNMLFWKSAGTLVTGETIKAAANATYATPTEVDTGDSNVPTTEGTALAIESAEGELVITYGASGVSGYTGYIRLQLQTTGSTPAGAVNQKTFTFQYDEV